MKAPLVASTTGELPSPTWASAEFSRRRDGWLLLVDGLLRWSLVAGAYFALMYVESAVGLLAAAAALAIGSVGLIGTVFHEAVHKNLPVGSRAQRFLGIAAGAPLGMSYSWWGLKHRQLHHSYPGDTTADPDIAFGSIVRVKPAQPWRWWHRVQCVTLLLAMPVVLFNSLRPIEVARMRGANQQLPRSRIVVEKYIPFAAFWSPMVLTSDSGIVKTIATLALAGFWGGLVVQLQHNTVASNSTTSDSGYRLPTAWQLSLTSDTRSRFGVLWWIAGSQTNHVAHHLYPRLTYFEARRATAKLREDRRWPEHSGLVDGVNQLFQHVQGLSRKPVQHATSALHEQRIEA